MMNELVKEALITVEGLVSGYEGEPICGPASFFVPPASCTAIIGDNGAGKSTLLRTITGRQFPIEGSVLFEGAPRVEGSLKWRSNVSVLLDDEFFLPNLNAEEHLKVIALSYNFEDPDSQVEDALRRWGIYDKKRSNPMLMSSGQRRRLLLAAAFMRPSRLLMLDEPEQRLDPCMRRFLIAQLQDKLKQGTAVIIVTHDTKFIEALANECICIKNSGEIESMRVSAGVEFISKGVAS